MSNRDPLQGTLELLILKTLTLGANYGLGIAYRIRQLSRSRLRPSFGSLYPALHRLELRGDVESAEMPSRPHRRAKVYALTPSGRMRLAEKSASWLQFVSAVDQILRTEQQQPRAPG